MVHSKTQTSLPPLSVRSTHTLPRVRPAAETSRSLLCIGASSNSASPSCHSSSFSTSTRRPVPLASAVSDTATAVPRILSPTLPSDSPSFSLTKWLSHKLGYNKYRPVIRLYASLSEQANSATFAQSNTTAIPACPSTACALLAVHMWVLNTRLRALAHDAWRNGREADAKKLHAQLRLLFNLAWQEMEHTLAEADDSEQQSADSELPSHYSVNDYQQLAYGAMVSYDRAWMQYRETGQRSDLMGALWRNVWTTAIPLHRANLHSLALYVEQAVQLSNRWIERDIAVTGAVQWPTLQSNALNEMGELLSYDSMLYDGSRVSTDESVGVPMHLWSRTMTTCCWSTRERAGGSWKESQTERNR